MTRQNSDELNFFRNRLKFYQVYILNTYVYEILTKYYNSTTSYSKIIKGFSKRQINLHNYRKILIPIFLKNKTSLNIFNNSNKVTGNWCLVSVDLKNKKILFYDSHLNTPESN